MYKSRTYINNQLIGGECFSAPILTLRISCYGLSICVTWNALCCEFKQRFMYKFPAWIPDYGNEACTGKTRQTIWKGGGGRIKKRFCGLRRLCMCAYLQIRCRKCTILIFLHIRISVIREEIVRQNNVKNVYNVQVLYILNKKNIWSMCIMCK